MKMNNKIRLILAFLLVFLLVNTAFSSFVIAEIDGSSEEPVQITFEQYLTVLEAKHYGSYTESSTGGIISADGNEALILLSYVDPSEYQHMKIVAPTGNAFILTEDKYAQLPSGQKVSFNGLGSEEYPFDGVLEAGTVSIDRALYCAVFDTVITNDAATGTTTNLTIQWKGEEGGSVIADYLVLEESKTEARYLNVLVRADRELSGLFGTIKTDDGQTINDETNPGLYLSGSNLNLNGNRINVVQKDSNAGFLCGTLESGNLYLDNLNLSASSYKVSGAIAGGLIGQMCEGTGLYIQEDMTLAISEVGGTLDAGGIVGNAENATIRVAEGKTVSFTVSRVKGTNVGGLYGTYRYTKNNGYHSPVEGFHQSTQSKIELYSDTNGSAGGFIGNLTLCGGDSVYLNESVTSSLERGTEGVSYGGVVGTFQKCDDGASKPALIVNANTKLTITVDAKTIIPYYAGLVGCMQGTYLKADQVNVNYTMPTSTTDILFGGVVADLGADAFLDGKDLLVKRTSGNNIYRGGGIVGEAREKSAVRLSGNINVYDVYLDGSRYKSTSDELSGVGQSGQLVGYQNSALVFVGNDFSYNRIKNNDKMDDIGNYGQLIRYTDVIAVDEANHTVSLTKPEEFSLANIDSLDDFVYLSLSWQTRGHFGEVISPDSDISLGADIDLTDTGITGITRDAREGLEEGVDEPLYIGTIDGGGHKITLDIGSTFGVKPTTTSIQKNGTGVVHMHNSLGLFAVFGGTAKNLTIDGTIKVIDRQNYRINIGALAGCAEGTVVILNVTTSPEITVQYDTSTVAVRAGGLFGLVEDWKGDTGVTLNGTFAPTIFLNQTYPDYAHFGGAIGMVLDMNYSATTDYAITIQAEDVIIGGEMKSAEEIDVARFHAGGLIGDILTQTDDYSHKKNQVIIQKLALNETITSPATEWSGGLLGALWMNTEVLIESDTEDYAISGTGTINAENASELGGLIYHASGKWELGNNAIDLSQMTLNVPAANAIGLLVCHGEPGAEAVDTNTDNSRNFYALYCLVKAHWDTAYKVCADGKIISSPTVFDEFVAYTKAKPELTSQTYVDMGNGAGIISLKSTDAVLHMDGADSNTYQNRSDVGKQVKTNQYSRYYYNLDTEYAKIGVSNNYVNTPSELLFWSLYRYAYKNLYQYVDFPDRSKSIGGANATNRVSLDMKGISYYPINFDGGASVSVQYADIVFYNEVIEQNEQATADQKLTSTNTQHKAMHCGLFHNFAEYTGSNTRTNTMTVNGVTFDGTVGKVDGGSGALICGSMNGRFSNGALAKNKLVLGSSDQVNYAVTLAGIRVTNAASGYAPVLVNHIGSYTELSVSYVTYDASQYQAGEKAGSSLIGTVGSVGTQKDVNIAIAFQGTVRLPANTENTIFTHATLLESFRYQNGGKATYNFVKQKDWNGDTAIHDVTYGYEITGSVENQNQQKWYNDEVENRETNYYVNATSSDTTVGTDFSTGYLPYVYHSPARQNAENDYSTANGYHELQVNLKIKIEASGCGTFGDPYVISDVLTLETYAEIARTGKCAKGVEVTLVHTGKINDLHNTTADASTYHVKYRFDGTTVDKEWIKVNNDGTLDTSKVLKAVVMQLYFRNAYYDIVPGTYTLENFAGFGSVDSPFRGVLLNSDTANDTTIILSGDSNPLIPATYGSIVYHLNVLYQGTSNLSLTTVDETLAEYRTPSPYSSETFGCVFGIVLGGDNFIDQVCVSASGNNITLSGVSHLIPVGGYVGSIVGGGVIFRNMSDTTGISNLVEGVDATLDDATHLYVNPLIGRVFDGFAFYETDSSLTVTLQNTNKNYQIPDIDPTHIDSVVNNNTISVGDQGLLILSAMVNSGAAGTASNSYRAFRQGSGDFSKSNIEGYYYGNFAYGKVRNEDYHQIGHIEENTNKTVLAQIVRNDNFVMPNVAGNTQSLTGELSYSKLYPAGVNTSYLFYHYFSKLNPTNICDTGVNIELTEDVDYRVIQNGWRGLSARYQTNAAFQDTTQKVDAVLLTLLSFDGQNHTFQVDNQIREYNDDNYHIASVGGLINILRTNGNGGIKDQYLIKDITVADSKVTLNYIDSEGQDKIEAENISYSEGKFSVSVGGIVGVSAGTASNGEGAIAYSSNKNYSFRNLNSLRTDVEGPYSAGGLFGAVGFGNKSSGAPGKLVARDKQNYFGINLVDCAFADVNVTGGLAAGGLVGIIGGNSSSTLPRDLGIESKYSDTEITSSFTATSADFVVGSNSVIKTSQFESTAGGLFGEVGTPLYINDSEYYNEKISSVGEVGSCVLEDVDVLANPDDHLKRMFIRTNVKYLATSVNASGNWETLACRLFTNYAGGVMGRIGGNYAFGCIKNVTIKGSSANAPVLIQATTNPNDFASSLPGSDHAGSYAAGAIAYDNYGSNAINTVITGFAMENVVIEGQKYSSGVIAMTTWSNSIQSTVLLEDICLKDTAVKSEQYAGGLLGYYNGRFSASNILLDNTSIATKATASGKTAKQIAEMYTGQLAGEGNATYTKTFYVAGLSVKLNEDTIWPTYEVSRRGSVSNVADYTNKGTVPGYVSYTDYEPKEADGQYVTTNPKVELPGVTLYGDALEAGKVFTIYQDSAQKTKLWYYTGRTELQTAYVNGVNYLKQALTFDSSMFSTYRTEQPDTNLPDEYQDFPVMALSGDQLDQVDGILNQYLNIITNDGFAQALMMENNETRNLVSVKALSYVYDEGQNQFVLDSRKNSMTVQEDSGKVTFKTTSAYDNTRDRFTLIEVTFYVEKPADIKDTTSLVLTEAYTLHIPVLIKRTMQVRFEATLSNGIDFYGEGYTYITNHALENIGNPVTAYLTYEYERDFTDEDQLYDWEKFLSEGGSLMDMDKTIIFDDGGGMLLPEGTQLSLIDCQNGNKVYTYTVGAGGVKNVKLSDFTSGSEHQKSQALSVLLGITINDDAPLLQKVYVETTVDDATIQIGDQYYRLATDEDGAKEHYAITIPSSRSPKEDYFLVWTVPKNDATKNLVLDGAIKTKVDSPVASDLNYAHRYNPGFEDDHVGTESTYNISGGYHIALEDMDDARTSCEMTGSGTPMRISVKSDISYYSNQKFSSSDELYHSITANLKDYEGEINAFPSSSGEIVAGDVSIYVFTEDGTYYTWNGSRWQASGTEKTNAFKYRWTSTGGDMVLRLSADNSVANAVSLATLRQMFLDPNTKTECHIYVQAEAELYFSEEAMKHIPENLSSDSVDKYVQLNYSAQLATKATELSNSAISARPNDNEDTHVKYYRVMNNQPKLTLDCEEINELGINVSDLEPIYYASYGGRNTSFIEMNADYDLSTVQKLEEVLKASTGVTFQLRLERQTGTGTTGYLAVENASEYIDFYCDQPKQAGELWTWTIPKEEYVVDDELKTDGLFNGERFEIPIMAYVNTDKKEFANYRIIITAHIDGATGVGEADLTNAYLVYTYSKIAAEFVEKDTD